MPSPSPPHDVDSQPVAGVSSLRSRFEFLTQEHGTTGSPPRSNSALSHTRLGGTLTPGGSPHSRPTSRIFPDDDTFLLPSAALEDRPSRSATPTSDQRPGNGKKPPPPPPPPRGAKSTSAAPPAGSPLLRPVPTPATGLDFSLLERKRTPGPPSPQIARRSPSPSPSPQPSLESLRARKPPPPPSPSNSQKSSIEALVNRKPPPPPSTHAPAPGTNGAATASTSGVATLRSRFATSAPGAPSRPSVAIPTNDEQRATPHTPTTYSPIPPLPPRRYGASFDHSSSEHASPLPTPPLPPRRHGYSFEHSSEHSSPLTTPPLVSVSPEVEGRSPVERPPLPPRHTGAITAPVAYTRGPPKVISTSPEPFSASVSRVASPPEPPARVPLGHTTSHPPPPLRHAAATRLPPRHQASLGSALALASSQSLPHRRSSSPADGVRVPPVPPPRPAQPPADQPVHSASAPSEPAPVERKPLAGKPPPPPTRTIALGAKLPEYRPTGGVSDADDSEADSDAGVPGGVPPEEDTATPDSSRSSRRPPTMQLPTYSENRIHVASHTYLAITAGNAVFVADKHEIRIYDLALSDAPARTIDLRELGLDWKSKELKVCALGWRAEASAADRGCVVWLGTTEGHLLELDARTGALLGVRGAAHLEDITHIFRHGRAMVTLDASGKALVFVPAGDEPLTLAGTSPRATRIGDKQDFVTMLGGFLWSSTRVESGPNPGGGARGPMIRVHDVFKQGAPAKSILPREHLSTVLSGAVVLSTPGLVYLGHSGGHISVWDVDRSPPENVDIVRIGVSDVSCLAGVNGRLWVGGRSGMLEVYDPSCKPWLQTNAWVAHGSHPVLNVAVDVCSIERLGRLCVVSIGKDERLRFWDGLLGVDWVEQELLKREREFSTFRDTRVLVFSWNVDSARPDALAASSDSVGVLEDAVRGADAPDIVVFGFQEVVDLESRRMAAKTVVLAGKKSRSADGKVSERVTGAYKRWFDKLTNVMRLTSPPDDGYTMVSTEHLVGLFTCVFVRTAEMGALTNAHIKLIKRGLHGRYGNKGAIMARLVVDDTSICFINCHLAAGQGHVRQRNRDVASILEDKSLFPDCREQDNAPAYVNGGDGSMVLDHEIVFLNGDMNYRIDLRRDAIISAVHAGEFQYLHTHDQLLKAIKFNRSFRLRRFHEAPLSFAPTYKYDRRSTEYDTSEKRRSPAWCDRILWRSRADERVQNMNYQRYEATVSDHRPISATFRVTVKRIDPERRAHLKVEVEAQWRAEQKVLLAATQARFIEQASIV